MGTKPQKGEKIEVVKILILAVVSFVLGFGLVIFFLSPDDVGHAGETLSSEETAESAAAPKEESEPKEIPDTAGGAGYAPSQTAGENPLMAGLDNGSSGDNGAGKDNDMPSAQDEADTPVEVPPGRTPEGTTLDGNAFYLKCWNSDGEETPGSGCDPLTVLEKRFSTRLYVVDKCKQAHAGAKAEGKLSIGMEVDFDADSVSFWNGASSTVENAGKVSTCLRNELKGLPIHSVKHKHSKYRLFFTVLFGKSTDKAPPSSASEANADEPAKPVAKGKMKEVIMDRVRVRKAPETGAIIGKISSGNQVTLIGKKGDWCEIITPNNNQGWMICEALK